MFEPCHICPLPNSQERFHGSIGVTANGIEAATFGLKPTGPLCNRHRPCMDAAAGNVEWYQGLRCGVC